MKKSIIIITSIFISILVVAVFIFVNENKTQNSGSNNISSNYQKVVDKKLPNITVYNKENKEISIESITSGKPVFIMYWASWCPDCQKQLPIIKKLYDEYKDRIEFILINIADGERETQDKALSYLKDKKYDFNYYSATENAIDLLKINTIPTKVIVTKDGIVKNIDTEKFSSYEKLKKDKNTYYPTITLLPLNFNRFSVKCKEWSVVVELKRIFVPGLKFLLSETKHSNSV